MKRTSGHWPALDGLRGIAILAVMAFHFEAPGLRGGFLGVDIFFVLSGYLITISLLNEWQTTGRVHFLHFYARRALRLLPALGLMLLAFAPNLHILDVLATVGYAANWATVLQWLPMRDGLLNHTWSLSIEEQFYLLWPAVLLFLLHCRLTRRRVIVMLCGLAVAFPLARLMLTIGGAPWLQLYYGARGEGLVIGSTLAWSLCGPSPHRVATFAATTAAAVLAVLLTTQHDSDPALLVGGFTMASLAVAVLMGHVLTVPNGFLTRVLSVRPLRQIGSVSYALYLWHVPIHMTLAGLGFPRQSPLTMMLAFVLTFMAASLSYRCIEAPALQLKRRFNPTNSTPRRASVPYSRESR